MINTHKVLQIITTIVMFSCPQVAKSVHTEAGGGCQASEAVLNLADFIERTFDGSEMACDDDTSFSAKFEFACRGESLHSVLGPEDVTVLRDGRQVYVVTELSEEGESVVMNELVYDSFHDYQVAAAPAEITPTRFLWLSAGSIAFYSDDVPSGDNWILSTWYLDPATNRPRGYKLYTDRSVECTTR